MQSSQPTEPKKNMNTIEEYLVRKDRGVFEHVLSFNPFELNQQENHGFRDLVDHYYAWESDLAKFLVP
jgi:hypothetical protein